MLYRIALWYNFDSLLRSRSGRSHAMLAWGQGALRDSGPSDCEGDYTFEGPILTQSPTPLFNNQ